MKKLLYKKTYKKGKVYDPDSMSICPTDCNKYFNDEDYQDWTNDNEQGSCICLKTFTISIYVESD